MQCKRVRIKRSYLKSPGSEGESSEYDRVHLSEWTGDPVVVGLVKSYAKPGGRVTGVHALTTHLDPKRLEISEVNVPQAPSCRDLYRSSRLTGSSWSSI